MSTGGNTLPSSLYASILHALEQNRAQELAVEIRTCVERGIVVNANDTCTSKTVRAMDSEEALAVALEFLTSTLSAMLMVQSTKDILDYDDLLFTSETNQSIEFTLPHLSPNELNELQAVLLKVVVIKDELGFTLPEIA